MLHVITETIVLCLTHTESETHFGLEVVYCRGRWAMFRFAFVVVVYLVLALSRTYF